MRVAVLATLGAALNLGAQDVAHLVGRPVIVVGRRAPQDEIFWPAVGRATVGLCKVIHRDSGAFLGLL